MGYGCHHLHADRLRIVPGQGRGPQKDGVAGGRNAQPINRRRIWCQRAVLEPDEAIYTQNTGGQADRIHVARVQLSNVSVVVMERHAQIRAAVIHGALVGEIALLGLVKSGDEADAVQHGVVFESVVTYNRSPKRA